MAQFAPNVYPSGKADSMPTFGSGTREGDSVLTTNAVVRQINGSDSIAGAKLGSVPGPESRNGGMDEIEFRHGSGRYNEPVRVVINGTPLTELWRAAGQRKAAPIWTGEVGEGLEWWGPGSRHPEGHLSDWVPDGFAPVLTCTCGEFGCGAAIARIHFERRVVTWTDFETANNAKHVALGPFIFSRGAYERARRAFSVL